MDVLPSLNVVWRLAPRYRFLLASLLLLFLLIPFTGDETIANWAVTVLFVAVLVSSLLAVGLGSSLLAPMLVLAVLTLVPFRFDPGGLLTQGPDLLFMAIVAGAILRDLARRQIVTLDVLYGAGCVYLLLGLCWGKVYSIVERSWPGSFALGPRIPVPPFAPLGTDALLMYLSFMTLTTTGYGDVTPLSPPARIFAVLEAIGGQLFLTLMIARLVGLYTAAAVPGGLGRSEPGDG